MSPPTKELMKLTLEQTLAHNGHPVLRWMMDNIFIRRDPAGNIKPDKEKSTEKIDGAVAMIMALDRAIRCGCVSVSYTHLQAETATAPGQHGMHRAENGNFRETFPLPEQTAKNANW